MLILLRSYCEADLRLCFRLCKLLVFSCSGSYSSQLATSFIKSVCFDIVYLHVCFLGSASFSNSKAILAIDKLVSLYLTLTKIL